MYRIWIKSKPPSWCKWLVIILKRTGYKWFQSPFRSRSLLRVWRLFNKATDRFCNDKLTKLGLYNSRILKRLSMVQFTNFAGLPRKQLESNFWQKRPYKIFSYYRNRAKCKYSTHHFNIYLLIFIFSKSTIILVLKQHEKASKTLSNHAL